MNTLFLIFHVELIENKIYAVMELQHKNLLDDHDQYNHLMNRNKLLRKSKKILNRFTVGCKLPKLWRFTHYWMYESTNLTNF
jgi:hypothetical protein